MQGSRGRVNILEALTPNTMGGGSGQERSGKCFITCECGIPELFWV